MEQEIKQLIDGDVETSQEVLEEYSHDTSLFEVKPEIVVFPKHSNDLRALIEFVNQNKSSHPALSLTARSGGTDMTGGAINDSIIVVFERYFKRMAMKNERIVSEPGVYYRDFETKTLMHNLIMPSYPASREICAIGGMVANNAGGEKSLTYGKTIDYVKRIKAMLSDGNEYEFRPLNKRELESKMNQDDFEGEIYRKVHKLIDENYETVKAAKPNVSKNSTGYNVWDVWDRENNTFDLTKLFVGSQGTLGLVTEAEFDLVEKKKHSGLLVGYVPDLDHLAGLVNLVSEHNPASFEVFDDHTFKFAMRFFFQFRKSLGWKKFIKLALNFIPDLYYAFKDGRIPKLIVLVEYEGDDLEVINKKIDTLLADVKEKEWGIELEKAENEKKSERFWLMRRESFNLLRKNVKNKHTAPFIDDLVVPPKNLPEFFPKLREILEKYELLYTIAGHIGDGNFHVIPLMDLSKESEREKIEPALRETIELVLEHGGSISGEHNDGMIRGPFLDDMYGEEVYGIFKQIKNIFDPQNIFNPHKKTDAEWQYSKRHMRDHF